MVKFNSGESDYYINCVGINGDVLGNLPGIKFHGYSKIDGYTILSIERTYFDKYREMLVDIQLVSELADPYTQTTWSFNENIFVKISQYHKKLLLNLVREKKLKRILKND